MNADKENNKPILPTQTQKPPSSLMFSKTDQDMVSTAIPKPKIIESKPVTTKSSSSSSSLINSNDHPISPREQQSSNVVTSPVLETGLPKISNSELIVTKTSPARGGPHDLNKVVNPPPAAADTTTAKTTSSSPIIEVPKVIPEVAKVTSAIGWKSSILQSSSSVEESAEVEMNLEQRVS